jgi:hypothetical protein
MKKFIFLALLLVVLGTASTKAQVAIGVGGDPHAGAILDLKSEEKGLLLPKVSLYDVEILQVGGSEADDDLSATGMIVYNTNDLVGDGIGIYVWDGHLWLSLIDCPLPAQPGEFSVIQEGPSLSKLYTISVDKVPRATSYKWSIPDDGSLTLNGPDNGPSISITANTSTILFRGELRVYAMNDCGNSATTANQAFLILTSGEMVSLSQLVTGGVYNGPTNIDNLSEATLSELTSNHGFSSTSNYLEVFEYELPDIYNAANAQTACAMKLGTGWRLPNIAELANMAENYSTLHLNSNIYWSSTMNASGTPAWIYDKSKFGRVNWGDSDGYVRCVRNQ